MLQNLHVKNLALIDETDVDFGSGLNILTGETGAGKSLLIGSINLALGGKADSDLIRNGADFALVELNFSSDDSKLVHLLEAMDIPTEEGDIFISRKIMQGRNVIKVNGETVNARQLKAITELLIDIHGQHEHQSLLQKKKHLEILDVYSGAELSSKLEKLKEEYKRYCEIKKELEEDSMDEDEKSRTMELLEFELNEIDKAELKIGEDEELEQTFKKLSNAKKIGEALTAVTALTGSDEEGCAGIAVSRALRELRSVSSFDSELEEMEKVLSDIEGMLHDFHRSSDNYLGGLEVDGETYYYTESRLNLINHLKDKYKPSIEEILEYRDSLETKKNELEDYEGHIADLERRAKEAYQSVLDLSLEISDIRSKKALALEEELVEILKELNFPNIKFKIRIDRKAEPNELGLDDVEFLISANLGEALRPLRDVASGGELSRIMLGIKTLLADADEIDTLIFDEVDAGISGKTAWQVAGKLGQLSKAHQVICITHLPQIAAKADNHFLIEKKDDGSRTNTQIYKLDEEGSVSELARLLGSENVTESALANARELLLEAHNI